MNLINFTDIDFSANKNQENKIINFNGSEIAIANYLPIQEKYNLIVNTLTKSDETDLYNSFKTKFYFELYLVLMYSSIAFTDTDKEDEIALYDRLKSSGLLDMIINEIPQNEKDSLWQDILASQEAMMKYRNSTHVFIGSILDKAPKAFEKLQEFLSVMDEEKIKTIANILVGALPNS